MTDKYKFRWILAVVTWLVGMCVVVFLMALPMSMNNDFGVKIIFIIGTCIVTAVVFVQGLFGVFDEKVVKK